MKPSFDQQLKQRLGHSTPEDLGYKPDRDKLWSRIEAKQNKKRLPIRLWLSHAAAIAAGLVIGYYYLNTYRQDAGQAGIKEIEQNTATILPKQQTANEEQASTASPAITKQPLPAAKAYVQHSLAVQPVPAKQMEPSTKVLPAQPDIVPVPEEPGTKAPIVAHNTSPKVKVLHLMDMKNENTRLMRIKEPEPQTGWARLIPDQDDPSGTETFSVQISKHILHPKNK